MKKVSVVTIFLCLTLIFSFGKMTFALVDNSPKVDLSAKASQSTIVKPQSENAQGNVDIHLTPSGMSTSINRDPIDVIFIFDESGSMAGSKLTAAKNAMTQAVNFFKSNAGPSDRFAFIPFSSDVDTNKIVYFSPDSTNNGLDKINSYANSLSASGGTNYTQSFEKAIDLFAGSQNNKNIIFMTDGEPTFSINTETVSYKKGKWITENAPVHYELGTNYYGATVNNVYYYDSYRNYHDITSSFSVTETTTIIKNHGIAMVNKLAQNNINLYSIGFGSNSDVDMNYLRELSSLTGVTARQANTDNISSIFQEISQNVTTPTISGEVSVDLSKFNGKVSLLDGSDARMDGNRAVYKFSFLFPINQQVIQAKDFSFPFSFSEIGLYTFDNITLTYKNVSGQTISILHSPVTIEVKADAPPNIKGTMTLNGVTNTVDNLMKESNITQNTNQFTVSYSLTPFGLVNSTVTGTLSNIRIIQPLPDGISVIPSTGVTLISYNGKPAAQIDGSQTINYKNGTFTPSNITASLKLQADWALSNVIMPTAFLQFKDSRFTANQETTIPASNQIINMKVKLNEFSGNIYYGDAAGIITKIDDSTKNIISQTEFPNNNNLKNKPIKDMIFVSSSLSKAIEVTYYDGDKTVIYLVPDFNFTGKDTGKMYKDGDIANELVQFKLSQMVPGKDVKYYYINTNQQNAAWTEFKPGDAIPVTMQGINKIKIKAAGGFAIDGYEIVKTINIQTVVLVTKITVNPEYIKINKFDQFVFGVKVEPDNATNKNLIWKSLNPSVVTVPENGKIFGGSTGRAVIEVSSEDGNAKTTVTVDVGNPLTGIATNPSAIDVKKGDNSINVNSYIVYLPVDATNIKTGKSFVSSDKYILDVDSNGNINAKRIGKASILITVQDEDGKPYQATLNVNVIDPDTDTNNDSSDKY